MAITGSAAPSWPRLLHAEGPPSVICIRLLVGLVFLSEGIQKFMYPDQLGPGRFERIGIPAATFFADLDGVVEIVCGTLVLLGLLTRVAAVPLLIDMVGAIVLTKLRALQPGGFLGVGLLGHGPRCPDRPVDAARIDLPAVVRPRPVVTR